MTKTKESEPERTPAETKETDKKTDKKPPEAVKTTTVSGFDGWGAAGDTPVAPLEIMRTGIALKADGSPDLDEEGNQQTQVQRILVPMRMISQATVRSIDLATKTDDRPPMVPRKHPAGHPKAGTAMYVEGVLQEAEAVEGTPLWDDWNAKRQQAQRARKLLILEAATGWNIPGSTPEAKLAALDDRPAGEVALITQYAEFHCANAQALHDFFYRNGFQTP